MNNFLHDVSRGTLVCVYFDEHRFNHASCVLWISKPGEPLIVGEPHFQQASQSPQIRIDRRQFVDFLTIDNASYFEAHSQRK